MRARACVSHQVAEGAKVTKGQPLAIFSAMKMETVVAAPVAGLVRHVAVVQGDALAAGDLLVVIEKEAGAAAAGAGAPA